MKVNLLAMLLIFASASFSLATSLNKTETAPTSPVYESLNEDTSLPPFYYLHQGPPSTYQMKCKGVSKAGTNYEMAIQNLYYKDILDSTGKHLGTLTYDVPLSILVLNNKVNGKWMNLYSEEGKQKDETIFQSLHLTYHDGGINGQHCELANQAEPRLGEICYFDAEVTVAPEKGDQQVISLSCSKAVGGD